MKELENIFRCNRCGKFTKRGVFNVMKHYDNNCIKPKIYKEIEGFTKESFQELGIILNKTFKK